MLSVLCWVYSKCQDMVQRGKDDIWISPACYQPTLTTTHSPRLFISFWLCWAFMAEQAFSSCCERGLLFVAMCAGFSLEWLLSLWSMGSRVHGLQQVWCVRSVVEAPGLQSSGSIVVAHGLRCLAACGILPNQGSNLRLLHLAGGFFTTEPPVEPSTFNINKILKLIYKDICVKKLLL